MNDLDDLDDDFKYKFIYMKPPEMIPPLSHQRECSGSLSFREAIKKRDSYQDKMQETLNKNIQQNVLPNWR